MRFCKAFSIVLLYIMLAVVNRCDNKTSLIEFRKYGPKGYEEPEYSIDKQGFRQGNCVRKSRVLDNIS